MIRHLTNIGLLAMLLMALASCEDHNDFTDADNTFGEENRIIFRCADMLDVYKGPENHATRASDPKNPDEKAIKTLHVFFFGSDGKLLTSTNYDNFRAYQKVTNASFIKIPTGEGVSQLFEEGDNDVTIVAIANIDATDDASSADDEANAFYTDYSTGGKIQQAGRTSGGEPYKIQSYEDLKAWVYYPRIRMSEDGAYGDISKLPEAGMPMISEPTKVNLATKPTETPIVNMKALMAKVNVSIKLEPDQFTSEYPLLKITEYGVRNMPIAVPFIMPTGEVRQGQNKRKPDSYPEYFEIYDVTDTPMFHKGDTPADPTHFVCDDAAHEFTTEANVTINKDSEAVLFSYYTFENINLPDYSAKRTNGEAAFNDNLEPQYPDGVKEEDYQRWKSTLAYSDRASALILKGEYTTHQGMRYQAQFTVYMGGDSKTDFMVKRNHRYDNNIVIHGLEYIRNSDDEAYTFDGRVNVHDDNPFYLAIVNERKVDAHATALPMDVWFMLRENGDGSIIEHPDWDTKIKFTVRNHESVDWIRMEKIPRSAMEAGNFTFGTGARDYFSTDLVTATLANNYEITVDGEDDGSRSRIYFYIDENVPTSNNPTNYGDRMATIDIEYVRRDADNNIVDRRVRTLDIEQKALLRVSGTWTGNDGKTATIPTTWMEYYEEYLEHSDPLDKHESPGELYSGLPWGLSGVRAYSFGQNNPDDNSILQSNRYYKVYYKAGAWAMIQWVFNQSGVAKMDKVHIFNTEVPPSAFHYCYGKNKRNSDGSVTVSNNKGWYMPGIRELEKALVDYYNTFPEFRGNLYWSASAAQETQGWTGYGQPGNYARATMVTLNGTTVTYATSGESDDPGYNPRSQANRIRAFYRVD